MDFVKRFVRPHSNTLCSKLHSKRKTITTMHLAMLDILSLQLKQKQQSAEVPTSNSPYLNSNLSIMELEQAIENEKKLFEERMVDLPTERNNIYFNIATLWIIGITSIFIIGRLSGWVWSGFSSRKQEPTSNTTKLHEKSITNSLLQTDKNQL
ncbi:hypothetical protein [Pseudomonas coronafaciens]|uniref:hypothetical protein n=1 Tax=Pseudomonas coronafaciens TaxID=53409 RepID=UPI0011C35C58|nr:hypothetical protein [Pseudomonas coronafaciens]